MKKHTLLPLVIALATASAASAATTIYSESFTGHGTTTSFSTFGWTAYQNDGTNRSTSTVDPMVVYNSGATIGSSTAFRAGQQWALTSDAPSINLANYQNDLTISFDHFGQDAGADNSATMGWRVFVTAGGTIYASDFISRHNSGTATTASVIVANSVWRVWTGETSLSDGTSFNTANISGTATTISGTISNIGLLAIDSADSSGTTNDNLRLSNFSITGTVIPEPSAALLGGLGLLALLRRRRA